MTLAFELLVAARYLRAKRKLERHRPLLLAWFALFLLSALTFGVHLYVERQLQAHFSPLLYALGPVLRYAKYVAGMVTVLVGFFLVLILFLRLTIFSTISTFGLFLGTAALVIVLSVMSGFEQDLKRKILGNHAHMVVTTPDRVFGDYREALARVSKVPGVVAGTPYLTSEVMLASTSNLSGVIIKGVDPESIGRVTDLIKNTDVGSMDNLKHPERLRTLGLGRGNPGSPPVGALRALEESAAPASPPDGGVDLPKAAPRDDIEALAPAEPPRRKERRLLPGLVIGRELAKNLRIFLGDDVNVVSPLGDVGPTGAIPKARAFRVAAIFFSGMYEYDSKYIYMLLPQAQKFLGVEDEVTGIELKLVDPENTEQVQAAVRAALAAPGKTYEVTDWKQLNRSLFSALKLEKIAMFIALTFIILVAAFSIVSNGIMLVLEKGREVAILKSMGASDSAVMRIFILMGLFMGVLGTGVGISTGILVCLLFDRYGIPLNSDVYYITKLPVNLNLAEVAVVLVASLVLALAATLYPAWQAARLRPVEALR